MGNYLDIMISAVKSGAKYYADGTRRGKINLRSSLPDIFEKMPESTPDNVYKKLVNLSANPQMTIYSAAKSIESGQKARKLLSELYAKIAAGAIKTGNKKRADIFEECRNNITNLTDKDTYLMLLDGYYKGMRTAEYSLANLKTLNIDKITAAGNSLVKVRAENGWHYRIPNGQKTGKSVDRISVNAFADEGLIKSLDELIGSGKIKGYYKTPDTAANWLGRHDPVTIYLYEKATPEVLAQVQKACGKYIRSTEDVLIGDKFAAGFALQKSPSKADIETLLKKAEDVDAELEQALRKYFTDPKSADVKTSAGYLEAAKRLLGTIS